MSASSSDLAIGQLLSLAPPTKELQAVSKDLLSMRPGSLRKVSKWSMDYLEKNNLKISYKPSASDFVVSKLSKLEPEQSPDDTTGYYANYTTGEVFSVKFPSLRVNKVMDDYSDSSSSGPLFLKVRDYILRNNLPDKYQLFEISPSELCILSGISELMEENFWSIHSSAKWTLERGAGGCFSLSGEVSVYAHYYENCNFHYKVGPVKIKQKDGISDLESVFDRIGAKKNKINLRISNQLFLTEAELDNGGTTAGSAHSSGRCSAVMGIQPTSVMKRLRRQLPIHKAKFDWNVARMNLMSNLS
jgi:hypothetical protein